MGPSAPAGCVRTSDRGIAAGAREWAASAPSASAARNAHVIVEEYRQRLKRESSGICKPIRGQGGAILPSFGENRNRIEITAAALHRIC